METTAFSDQTNLVAVELPTTSAAALQENGVPADHAPLATDESPPDQHPTTTTPALATSQIEAEPAATPKGHHGLTPTTFLEGMRAKLASAAEAYIEEFSQMILQAERTHAERVQVGRRDAHELIRTIRRTQVDVDGNPHSVEEIVTQEALYAAGHTTLHRAGITLCTQKRGRRSFKRLHQIFLAPDLVKATLLKGTAWENANLAVWLLLLPGAKRHQRRLEHGVREWGVVLPHKEDFLNGERAAAQP